MRYKAQALKLRQCDQLGCHATATVEIVALDHPRKGMMVGYYCGPHAILEERRLNAEAGRREVAEVKGA